MSSCTKVFSSKDMETVSSLVEADSADEMVSDEAKMHSWDSGGWGLARGLGVFDNV